MQIHCISVVSCIPLFHPLIICIIVSDKIRRINNFCGKLAMCYKISKIMTRQINDN